MTLICAGIAFKWSCKSRRAARRYIWFELRQRPVFLCAEQKKRRHFSRFCVIFVCQSSLEHIAHEKWRWFEMPNPNLQACCSQFGFNKLIIFLSSLLASSIPDTSQDFDYIWRLWSPLFSSSCSHIHLNIFSRLKQVISSGSNICANKFIHFQWRRKKNIPPMLNHSSWIECANESCNDYQFFIYVWARRTEQAQRIHAENKISENRNNSGNANTRQM